MSLQNEIETFFINFNKKVKTNNYTHKELRQAWVLLRVETAYIQYIMKNKIGMNGDNILISHHKGIITDYIKIIKRISQDIININPELYYLILSYLRIIENDNKILLKSRTKFITIYISSIQNRKVLNSPINIIALAMELADNFKSLFARDVYNINNKDKRTNSDFTYIKKIMSITLENYEELQSSSSECSTYSSNSSDVFIDDETCDNENTNYNNNKTITTI